MDKYIDEDVKFILLLLIMVIGTSMFWFKITYKKVIQTETKNIEAVIVSTKYKASSSNAQIIWAGDHMIPMTSTSSAEYNVTIKYKNNIYTIDDREYYFMCENKNNRKVDCTLNIYYYEDGSSHEEIEINSVE